MAMEINISELVERARNGDREAANELLKPLRAWLRQVAPVVLKNIPVRNGFGSDLCQDVLLNFYREIIDGRFQAETPDDVMRFLRIVLRNKAIKQVEHDQAACRDVRREADVPVEELPLATMGVDPEKLAMWRERLSELRGELDDKTVSILELRLAGCSWDEIGREFGSKADSVRLWFNRVLSRFAEERARHNLH